jgi:hypothetical protein
MQSSALVTRHGFVAILLSVGAGASACGTANDSYGVFSAASASGGSDASSGADSGDDTSTPEVDPEPLRAARSMRVRVAPIQVPDPRTVAGVDGSVPG